RLTASDLSGVLPGMNAVATLVATEAVSEDSWLVLSNSILTTNGDATVTLVRDGMAEAIPVTVGGVQGEWTLVQSARLQAGDSVVGTLTTSDDESGFMMGGPPAGGASMGVPMGSPPN
ncbi:MAG: hypothetical protein ACRC1H_06015, partial [Caldilineaceae bacterium]